MISVFSFYARCFATDGILPTSLDGSFDSNAILATLMTRHFADLFDLPSWRFRRYGCIRIFPMTLAPRLEGPCSCPPHPGVYPWLAPRRWQKKRGPRGIKLIKQEAKKKRICHLGCGYLLRWRYCCCGSFDFEQPLRYSIGHGYFVLCAAPSSGDASLQSPLSHSE